MKFRALFATLLTALLVVGGVTAPAAAAPGDVAGASLNWGVKQSFRTYIAGPIAHGTTTLSGNLSGAFTWSGGSGSASQAAATGSVGYTGSVHFQGHETGVGTGVYMLDMTVSDVKVVQTSATAAQIVADVVTNSIADPATFVTYSDIAFADVNLTGTSTSTSTTVSYSAAPATLTASGSAAFSGMYAEGAAIDPVSFTWPVEQAPVPPTPTVTVSKSSEISPAGEIITVTGTGFAPQGSATNGTRPPLSGAFGGVYVAFGKFAEVWKPSATAPSSARKTGSVVWVVNPESVATVTTSPGSAVAINSDGSFSVQLLVKRGYTGEPATGNFGIYTYPGSGSTYAAFETYTPIAFTAATPTTTSLTVTPATGLVEGGSATLSAQIAPIAAGTVSFRSGDTALGAMTVDSTGLATLAITGLAAGEQAYAASFAPEAPLLFAGSTGTASVTVAPKVVGAGSLSWGIKSSFRSYVTGTIARGSITTSGVGTAGGAFTFGQRTGGSYSEATGTGSSNYSGSVRFYGHGGLLDITFANPVVTVTGPSTAVLSLSVNGGSSVAFATLNLGAGSTSTANNTVSYSGVPATLTAQGSAVFEFNGSSFYPAGTSLDPVSFVIGSASTAGTGTKTIASFRANTADATPPATTGVTLVDGSDPSSLVEGEEYSFEAEGFAPGETGVLFVHYSDPVVLADDLTADSSGTVSWTGNLPAGLTGEHTFTFQGSVDRGIVVTINPQLQTAALDGCDVTAGDITWGFKESFRSYISGSIANGEWTVADGATYETPNFGFTGATGVYDPATASGQVDFTGSITFTGHGGVLNTTVANPSIRFDDADTAYVLLDVSGTTQEGQPVASEAVEFVRLDLAAATVETADDGTVTITDAPAELTANGAAAFGTYETGEAFDPVTVSFSTASDCAKVAPLPVDEDVQPVSSSTDLGWLLWLVLALIVIAALVATVVIVRRRSAN